MVDSQKLYKQIIELLSETAADSEQRLQLLRTVFADIPMIQAIKLDAPPDAYALEILNQALLYGNLSTGEAALKALLTAYQKLQINQEAEYSTVLQELTDFNLSELKGLIEDSVHHTFLSYSRINSDFVKKLAQDLRDRGVAIWLDIFGLVPGTADWELALRDAISKSHTLLLVASPDSRVSKVVRDEIAVAQMLKKQIFPVWAKGEDGAWIDSIPMGLGYVQYVDMRGDAYAKNIEIVATQLHSRQPLIIRPEKVSPCTDDAPRRNPFVGLKSFSKNDKDYFFGRTALVQKLVKRVANLNDKPRFIQLLGPSGSGKSSIMLAGVLPALQAGELIEESEKWLYLKPISPGKNPIENLTIALWEHLPEIPFDIIKENLNAPHKRGLHLITQRLVSSAEQRLLLYVDQFEEVFTQSNSEVEMLQFIDLLTNAAQEIGGQTIILSSVRADFYDRLLQYRQLSQMLPDSAENVEPMSLADIYEIIREPVSRPEICLRYDEELVPEMVYSLRDHPESLPLLQFSLDQLFRQREARQLTMQAYRAMGEISGALSQHAEETYKALPTERHQKLANNLFLRLIVPSKELQMASRSQIKLSEMVIVDEAISAEYQTVIERFVEARLLTVDENTLVISHDALIRHWVRLAEWLEGARENASHFTKLRHDVEAWLADGQQEDYDGLYTGNLLERIEGLVQGEVITSQEEAFIKMSRLRASHLYEAELAQERSITLAKDSAKQAQTLAATAQSQAKRNRRGAVLILLIAILSLAGFGYWTWQTINNNAVVEAFITRLQEGLGENPYEDTDLGTSEILTIAIQQAETAALAAPDFPSFFDGVEMVYVPTGYFWGTASYELQWLASGGFWIDRYEVSWEQYSNLGGLAPERDCKAEENADDLPRTCIFPEEAIEFCESQRHGQLPTNIEWEYGARGPYSLLYPWGKDFHEGYAIFDSPQLAPISGREIGRSWVGAEDMSGNIAEWLQPDETGYLLRGGTFDDPASNLRLDRFASMSSEDMDYYRQANAAQGLNYVGFRCIRYPEP